jgi:uncharacterized protein with HEPN domain
MRSEFLYLQDILEAITAIERFLRGVEKSVFLADDMLQSAVLYKLIIIGEATAKISDETKRRHPQTSWKKIVGLRNISAHAYFSVDWEAIWATAQNQLKPLQAQVTTILQNDFPDFEIRSDTK